MVPLSGIQLILKIMESLPNNEQTNAGPNVAAELGSSTEPTSEQQQSSERPFLGTEFIPDGVPRFYQLPPIECSPNVWHFPDSDPFSSLSTLYGLEIVSLRRHYFAKFYASLFGYDHKGVLEHSFKDAYPIGVHVGTLVGNLISETKFRVSAGQISHDVAAQALRELTIGYLFASVFKGANLFIANGWEHPVVCKWTAYYKYIG